MWKRWFLSGFTDSSYWNAEHIFYIFTCSVLIYPHLIATVSKKRKVIIFLSLSFSSQVSLLDLILFQKQFTSNMKIIFISSHLPNINYDLKKSSTVCKQCLLIK